MVYRSGFTLLEIIIVLLIFIILASIFGGRLFDFGFLVTQRNVNQIVDFYDKVISLSDMTDASYLIVLDHQRKKLLAFETTYNSSSVCNNLDRLVCEFRIKTLPAFNLALRAIDQLEEANFDFEKAGLKILDSLNLNFLEEKDEISLLFVSPNGLSGDLEVTLELKEAKVPIVINPVLRLVSLAN